jgi:hypothetical protein
MEEKGKLESFLEGRYFVPVVIILVAIVAFCLGRVSGLEEKREPVRVTTSPGTSVSPSPKLGEGTNLTNAVQNSASVVVASKNGTKYHYPWCAGAKQISPQNLITFDSIAAARAAGLTPATNCKGLK